MSSIAVTTASRYDGGMPRRFDDPNRMSGRQAASYLGMKEGKFYEFVRKGFIPRQRDKYYKLGYYLKSDLDAFERSFNETPNKQ